MLFALWALSACTATIQVYGAPDGAEVYLSKSPPTPNAKPAMALSQGKLPNATFTTNYFVWDQFYVWVGKEGYETRVMKIPNEAKVLPIVIGATCIVLVVPAIAFLWAAGPTANPINVELER
ncbi:MAG: hypothetical protein ABMA64_22725 [Myxococcota bacterium]|jgi:hypothetical protein